MEKQFDEISIRSLLKELDKKITSPCCIEIASGIKPAFLAGLITKDNALPIDNDLSL